MQEINEGRAPTIRLGRGPYREEQEDRSDLGSTVDGTRLDVPPIRDYLVSLLSLFNANALSNPLTKTIWHCA